jgi:hypothetical protein
MVLVGLAGVQPIAGSLRNIGVSRFRASDGIVGRLYPLTSVCFQYDPGRCSLFVSIPTVNYSQLWSGREVQPFEALLYMLCHDNKRLIR